MIAYNDARATAADYSRGAAMVTFSAEQTTQTTMITIAADNEQEYFETFDVVISIDDTLAMTATVSSPSTLQVTIKDRK